MEHSARRSTTLPRSIQTIITVLDHADVGNGSVATDIHLFKGMPHGFRRFGDQLSASKRWDRVIEEGIKWALHGAAASGKFEVRVE